MTKLTGIDGGKRPDPPRPGLAGIVSNVNMEGGRLTEASFFKGMLAVAGKKHLRSVK